MTRRNIRNATVLGTAAVLLATAAAVPALKALPLGIALLCLFVWGTSLGHAGRLSEALVPFRNRRVEIRVWGALLQPGGEECEIETIRAIGVGLHLFVRHGAVALGHLKIAQPRDTCIGETSATIGDARYIQWQGRKLPRAVQGPAVTVTLREAASPP